ncbi:MAG: hypothetical protein IPM54_38340 [Polyangiaceae bacterium]|nr:hypothetical protein [Polyangiaceae bacterium]
MSRPVGATDVRLHLMGRGSIAVRPRFPDGSCLLGVIDIDDREAPPSPEARAFAYRICHVARAWQWTALLETTGGRGLHVWVPLESRMKADVVHAALEALVHIAGPVPEGVHCEILPGRTDAPDLHGQTMTLPLGVHVETGVRSRLHLPDGEDVDSDLNELSRARATAPERLKEATTLSPRAPEPSHAAAEPLPDWSRYGRGVERIMAGCAILRHLAEKARDMGHLNHGERLSLLYSLGHLDAPGAQAIHAIIRPCGNYDAVETSRQIANLRGLPVSCTRLREKHATPELVPLCRCDFGDLRHRGGYATPLLHAGAFRREWRGVLRERREAEAALKTEQDVGVRVATENGEGVVLRGLPPHEWA